MKLKFSLFTNRNSSGGAQPPDPEARHEPRRGWRPPGRTLWLRTLDKLIVVGSVLLFTALVLLGWLFLSGELETFMIPVAIFTGLLALLFLPFLIPTKAEVEFDHFAVIERWAQPHRVRGMGYVWYWPRLGERIFAIKRMRSEATVIDFEAHTKDGVKVKGKYRFWIKPIEGTDPFAAAYRLAKTGGKIDQFGRKCVEEIIASSALTFILNDRVGFHSAVTEATDTLLRTYLHRVRDGSLGSLELPREVNRALEETFVAQQRVQTAAQVALEKMALTAAEPTALLTLFAQFMGTANDEQKMRLIDMVMNHKAVQEGGHHISMSIPNGPNDLSANSALVTALLAKLATGSPSSQSG